MAKNKQKKTRQNGALRELVGKFQDVPLIVHGSAFVIPPKTDGQKTRYVWTKKVDNKTVSIALSRQQYYAVQRAIAANRRMENELQNVRRKSEKMILETIPGVKRRRRSTSTSNEGDKSS